MTCFHGAKHALSGEHWQHHALYFPRIVVEIEDNGSGIDDEHLNFEGQANELWCKGGEKMFIKNMIKESKQFYKSCQWFTTLVSKKENLNSFYEALTKVEAKDVRTIKMTQGHKRSRILAWTFSTKKAVEKNLNSLI